MTVISPAYTMDEAAKLLRISRRALQELVKTHPFYYQNGNRKLFTEQDILALRTAMRPQHRDLHRPYPSCRPSAKLYSGSVALGSLWEEALRRVADLKRQDQTIGNMANRRKRR